MKLLVLDNYDSFTYNLVHLIEKVSEIPFDVIRNDKISIDAVKALR
jgi:anthranilate synthase component 2